MCSLEILQPVVEAVLIKKEMTNSKLSTPVKGITASSAESYVTNEMKKNKTNRGWRKCNWSSRNIYQVNKRMRLEHPKKKHASD